MGLGVDGGPASLSESKNSKRADKCSASGFGGNEWAHAPQHAAAPKNGKAPHVIKRAVKENGAPAHAASASASAPTAAAPGPKEQKSNGALGVALSLKDDAEDAQFGPY